MKNSFEACGEFTEPELNNSLVSFYNTIDVEGEGYLNSCEFTHFCRLLFKELSV